MQNIIVIAAFLLTRTLLPCVIAVKTLQTPFDHVLITSISFIIAPVRSFLWNYSQIYKKKLK